MRILFLRDNHATITQPMKGGEEIL